jgi:acyl-coenzyme A thioesterase PaaI-like protein
MPANSSVLGVEYKINLLEAPKGERFIARGAVIKSGRTLNVVECDVEAEQGGKLRLVARMLATMMCVEGRSELAD